MINFAPAVRRALASGAHGTRTSSVTSPLNSNSFLLPWNIGPKQRRLSSSRSSNPDDGSKDLSAFSSGPKNSEKRKRRKDTPFGQLPSVPSTQHLSQEALWLSSFFSLHRPISVTNSLPKPVTAEAFAAIFQPKSKSAQVTDVISTLSKAVDDLEAPVTTLEMDSKGNTIAKAEFKAGEANPQRLVDSMLSKFLPFQPPPMPKPQESAADAADAAQSELEAEPGTRVYRAIFTIEETTETNGDVRVVAHTPEIMPENGPRSYMHRLRQFRYQDAMRRNEVLEAISVKRQRKLKMKKKKYKKLMRRTRNERRKLDRL